MAEFPSTQWSLIRDSALSRESRRTAFGALVQAYQPAMRAYLRARLPADEVEDALQSFLARSFEHAWFARADPAFGSFRTFLLVMLRRHLGHWRDKWRPDCTSLETIALRADDADDHDPQRAFDARFLAALTQRALERLRSTYAARGRALLFEALLPLLSSPPGKGELGSLAQRLGVPANSLAVELRRLRERLGSAMRDELAALCADEETVEREWQALRRL